MSPALQGPALEAHEDTCQVPGITISNLTGGLVSLTQQRDLGLLLGGWYSLSCPDTGYTVSELYTEAIGGSWARIWLRDGWRGRHPSTVWGSHAAMESVLSFLPFEQVAASRGHLSTQVPWCRHSRCVYTILMVVLDWTLSTYYKTKLLHGHWCPLGTRERWRLHSMVTTLNATVVYT